MTDDQQQPRNIPTGDTRRSGDTGHPPLHSASGSRRLVHRPRTVDDLLSISWRLEPRDYVIAHLLAEHRFLTTDQITAVLFHSPRTCRNRLNVLRRLGFIDWFQPIRPGARPSVHWIAGRLSAPHVA